MQTTLDISSHFICSRIWEGIKSHHLHPDEKEKFKQVKWLVQIHIVYECQSKYLHPDLPNVKLGIHLFWWHKLPNSLFLSPPTLKLTPAALPVSPGQEHMCTMNNTMGRHFFPMNSAAFNTFKSKIRMQATWHNSHLRQLDSNYKAMS